MQQWSIWNHLSKKKKKLDPFETKNIMDVPKKKDKKVSLVLENYELIVNKKSSCL